MYTVTYYLRTGPFLLAALLLICDIIYILHIRSKFHGKLPVRFLLWFGRNRVDAMFSPMMRKYMKTNNLFSTAFWVSLALGLMILVVTRV